MSTYEHCLVDGVGYVLLEFSTPLTHTLHCLPLPKISLSSNSMYPVEISNLCSFFTKYLAMGLCICSRHLPVEASLMMIGVGPNYEYSKIIWNHLIEIFPILHLWTMQSQVQSSRQCQACAPFHGVDLKLTIIA